MAARKHLLVLLTLLTAACTVEQSGTPSPAPGGSSSTPAEKAMSTKVRAVIDGRTVELADGTKARISLLAEPSPCAAAAALEFAQKTLVDKDVQVGSITPGEVTLLLSDGTDYALLAVKNGILRTTGVDGGPMMEAESKASKAKLGLWAQDCPTSTTPPTPVPPPPPPPPAAATSTSATTPPPPPPPAPPSPPCVVVYRVNGQWPGAFQAEVTVRNVSGALMNGWTLRWRFPDGQTVAQMWNGSVSQSGGDVSVTNTNYNALIVPNGSVSVGFNGSVHGRNSAPTSFSLNGTPCTTA
ncbi:cellulose binding domain-containing protein [Lentzea sp. NPDC004782]|uniref:cellulose binding domain-containing protein n=1 Tax=Lentzea sp. NPDC004782 TaxID=3154458 RepID=UPI00339DD16A